MLVVDFVREVCYSTWLANVVIVPKNNNKWSICIDYTDLNKVCSKDSYHLPRIDQLVDSVSRHEVLSFLDGYSGYNQIPMHFEDVEKTAFITEHGTYCYTMMPFGLKNGGVTFQCMMARVFEKQIGEVVEVM